jgi:cell division protein FtsZ
MAELSDAMKRKKTIRRLTEKNPGKGEKKPSRSPARVKVVGVGGGGGNAISRMKEDFVKGVEFVAINTDAQDLDYCNAHKKIYIGKTITRGLGAGMNPELGRQAAEESRTEIADVLRGADLVFITCGMGGGTGSVGVSVVAEVAKEVGALTIAVVTKPFTFEGGQRMRIANEALAKLKEKVDAFVVVPNDRIFSVINKETSIVRAFEAIDDVLRNAVRGIAELIAMPGIINIDFADVRAIMQNSGDSIVGIGLATGKDRAIAAVNQSINSPLLESSIEGARGVLFGVSGGRDLKMNEINDIAKVITDNIDSSAKIIFGAYHDRKLKQGQLKVTLIATGFTGNPLIKKTDSSPVTNLFGEKVSVEMSLPKLEPKPILMEANNLAFSKHKEDIVAAKESPAGNGKKKSVDIFDIPAFLRKKRR